MRRLVLGWAVVSVLLVVGVDGLASHHGSAGGSSSSCSTIAHELPGCQGRIDADGAECVAMSGVRKDEGPQVTRTWGPSYWRGVRDLNPWPPA